MHALGDRAEESTEQKYTRKSMEMALRVQGPFWFRRRIELAGGQHGVKPHTHKTYVVRENQL